MGLFFAFYLRIAKLKSSNTKKIYLIVKILLAKLKHFLIEKMSKAKEFLKNIFEAIFCFLCQIISHTTG